MNEARTNECQNAAFVGVGDGAQMTIPNSELQWICRYGNIISVRYLAASCLESYDYLMGSNISEREAFRRLRLLRRAKKEIAKRRKP